LIVISYSFPAGKEPALLNYLYFKGKIKVLEDIRGLKADINKN